MINQSINVCQHSYIKRIKVIDPCLFSALVIQFVSHRFTDYHDPTIGMYFLELNNVLL